MPAQKRSWGQLVGGIISLGAVIALVLAILLFARVGALRGDTYKLYLITSEARGILKGSEVWLEGKKVGLVSDIDFRKPGLDKGGGRLLIELEILSQYQTHIRNDSYTLIRSGGSLIGSPVVYLTQGSPSAQPIQAGKTVQGRGQVDAESFTSDIALASRQFPEIIGNLKTILKEAKAVSSTLAGEGEKQSGFTLGGVGSRTARLGNRAIKGDGTIGMFLNDADPLADRATRAISRADSIMLLINNPRGSLTRLQGDSLLTHEIGNVRNEISIVRALMAGTTGTVGRMKQDSAVIRQLKRLESELGKTIEDLKREPLRYIVF